MIRSATELQLSSFSLRPSLNNSLKIYCHKESVLGVFVNLYQRDVLRNFFSKKIQTGSFFIFDESGTWNFISRQRSQAGFRISEKHLFGPDFESKCFGFERNFSERPKSDQLLRKLLQHQWPLVDDIHCRWWCCFGATLCTTRTCLSMWTKIVPVNTWDSHASMSGDRRRLTMRRPTSTSTDRRLRRISGWMLLTSRNKNQMMAKKTGLCCTTTTTTMMTTTTNLIDTGKNNRRVWRDQDCSTVEASSLITPTAEARTSRW